METELQFDRVQQPAGTACSTCQGALQGSYFQANGHIMCEACAGKARSVLEDTSGGFGRFVKATVLGIGGGLAGGVVYTAVLALAHINAALITILIGWLVGKGVSKGCGGRGGTGYQILAVLITYGTIGLSSAVSEMATSDLAGGSILKGIFVCIFGLVAGGIVVAFSSILGAIITFFGLAQAWSLNKAAKVEITGPHALVSEPAVAVTEEPPPLPAAPPALPQGA